MTSFVTIVFSINALSINAEQEHIMISNITAGTQTTYEKKSLTVEVASDHSSS